MRWKTAINQVKNNRTIIRGYDLDELIQKYGFVATIFLLLKGELPKENEKCMLDALFTAAIDHGVGAPSTTVARIAASCGNKMHTALAAGIAAIGERHGGAIEDAAKFFQEHADEQNIENLVKNLKEQKIRIPGFGHKVLTYDSRSETLFKIAKETSIYSKHCKFAEAVGAALNKISSKPLPLNIDGAMAAIISDMGFDSRLAQGFFLIARMPGLVAHVHEELTSGEGVRRLCEDEEEYIGPSERNLRGETS